MRWACGLRTGRVEQLDRRREPRWYPRHPAASCSRRGQDAIGGRASERVAARNTRTGPIVVAVAVPSVQEQGNRIVRLRGIDRRAAWRLRRRELPQVDPAILRALVHGRVVAETAWAYSSRVGA